VRVFHDVEEITAMKKALIRASYSAFTARLLSMKLLIE
jgi:hypothetical protein